MEIENQKYKIYEQTALLHYEKKYLIHITQD
jgi:hypothetical protein